MEIRKLKWTQFSEGIRLAKANPVGGYAIDDYGTMVQLKHRGRLINKYKSVDEAELAAQTHYEYLISQAFELES